MSKQVKKMMQSFKANCQEGLKLVESLENSSNRGQKRSPNEDGSAASASSTKPSSFEKVMLLSNELCDLLHFPYGTALPANHVNKAIWGLIKDQTTLQDPSNKSFIIFQENTSNDVERKLAHLFGTPPGRYLVISAIARAFKTHLKDPDTSTGSDLPASNLPAIKSEELSA